MNISKFFIGAFAILFSSAVMAQEKSASFTVSGNCGMCKKSIEKAAKIPGVSSINWNSGKQLASVVFDSSKVSVDLIQRNIAAVGYDTEMFTAETEAYNALPGCCQYERVKPKEVKRNQPVKTTN